MKDDTEMHIMNYKVLSERLEDQLKAEDKIKPCQ